MDPIGEIDATFLARAGRFWHPAVAAARLLERDLAVYRDRAGAVHVLDNRCAHRGTRWSDGYVDGACVRSPYHALAYAADDDS